MSRPEPASCGARKSRVEPVWTLVCATAVAVAGCGGPNAAVPFRAQPIPYADTLPIAQPAERDVYEPTRLLEVSVGGEIGHAFSTRRWLAAQHEALNVTRFDDVVNSAWFEHRNGQHTMSLAEVARGPTRAGPDTSRTLTVVAGKGAGISPGFTVRDADGQTFLFKFDPAGNLRLASAAGVIANRFFYAAGYHTPEDYIVVFDGDHLELDPGAELTTDLGKRAMTEADIRQVLDLTDPLPDGRYLALASKFLPGRLLGPFLFSGVRKDDPNDHFHHQYRRELRGLYVVSSWLNHVDMRYANTQDVFIDPPGYVKHYLLDFAASLGSGTIRSHKPREGREYNFDFWPTMGRIFTAGFYQVGWEEEAYSVIHPSVGWLAAGTFAPEAWHSNWPNEAFRRRTVRDNYWGAKLVGSFSDEQIAAVVAEGQLPVEAAQALVRILIIRRDKIVAHWYSKVAPLENPATGFAHGDAVSSSQRPRLVVSFEDLGLVAGVWQADETAYRWRFQDPASGTRAEGVEKAAPGPHQRISIELRSVPAGQPAPANDDGLATLHVAAIRPGCTEREAVIYLRWTGEHRGYDVVGLTH